MIDETAVMRRLEQVAALVVAAGLALVSYWLFFSWAGGGGPRERRVNPSPKPQVSVPVKAPLSL
ncbi:MAG: hypothetical protein ACPG3W_08565 [Synechococcus sp.]|uniref:hypothetical protein n=1 Tax=unclassified Synechococcus TaxID=2626047 RepID=UPI0001525039|nr:MULTISPECIES: hypothetical protein [unclassified Synechococcus]MCT0251454.1 hypothetical protein [Synechococcus sp. CS-197]PTU03127.1 hypothetical protein DBR45_08695 [Pseudomonas sp. HMWF031]QNI68806.1 hypothetical protein SynBMKMC1_02758 [Synechococcus sp. BMK-MC-1]CAK24610.1 Uncharacterized conserved membrane protein [Synechococcus sp. WH 7803]